MGEKTIKQRIELTGEKQYTQAIRDANRNLKVMQSQLKAENAELGRNASAQQKNEVKTKSLTKQIGEQEKIVQTLKEALAQAQEEYGDNADVVAKWETKLNNARTTLGNMRGELESLSSGLGENGRGFREMAGDAEKGVIATRSFAEALGSVADAGGAVSDKIQGIFTGMVDTIRDAITSVWEDVTELAGRANEWADLAGFWNTSAANIQKWYHSVNASHNDFATLNSAVNRIVMADQKKIVESAHVSAEGYTDQWEYAMAVLDSLAGMDYNPKLAALENIFGEKRATGVLDLLNDWETIRGNLDRFDTENGGLGMTEEQMSDMAKLAEQVDTINETWKAFKDSFTAGAMGQLSLDLTGNVQGALDALISFMDAKDDAEREAALEEFTKNITDFFDRLGKAISAAAEAMGTAGKEMQGSENGIVRALGDLLVTLKGAMEWFADEGNIDLVIKGFEALAAFWLAGRGLQMAAKISEMVANIATIKAFGGGGAVTAAGGAVAGGTGGGWLGTLLGSTAGKVIGGSAAFLSVLFGDLLRPGDPTRGNASEIEANTVNADGTIMVVSSSDSAGDAFRQALEEGRGTDWSGTGETVYKRHRTGDIHDRPETVEEYVDLDAHTRADAENAIQDWWDAWRDWNYAGGEESEADRGFGWMQEVLGEGFGDVWDRLITKLDETEKQENLEDIPAGWYKDILDSLDFGEQNGVTSEDISGLRGLPALIQAAAENGTASGVSGIQVNLDGYRVGQLVAPYVSRELGGMITR